MLKILEQAVRKNSRVRVVVQINKEILCYFWQEVEKHVMSNRSCGQGFILGLNTLEANSNSFFFALHQLNTISGQECCLQKLTSPTTNH